VAVNISVADNAVVSVAVTLMVRLWAVDGAVPVKVSVFALNLSQVGSACPFDNVAVYFNA
jgi:hypothetical protein